MAKPSTRVRISVGVLLAIIVVAGVARMPAAFAGLSISSPAFAQNGSIPAANTCDGTSGNPPLVFSGVPSSTRSLAVIVEDPDVPWILQPDRLFVHWVVWDLPPQTEGIPEGKATGGLSEGGAPGYADPCPPDSEHRYVFKLFALDTTLGPAVTISKADDLYRAMDGHTLAHAELVGRYRRPFSKRLVPLVALGILLLCGAAVLYGGYRIIRVLRG
jgi:Raf kinase inhibitor-like YbhB/YbcL family protein